MCGTPFPAEALFVCDQCLGPLEVTYDYDAIRGAVTRDEVSARPENLWRYRELLPVKEPRTGFHSGFTPLVKADRLAKRLGVRELYIKDDSVNHPTFSYKDRVVSVAATRAVELGFDVFACASTGNLANSVAAHAARLGLTCYVFIPDNLEPAKVMGSAVYRPHVVAVKGNYDDINRLCTQIADRHGWGFANINLRTYYAEGAKTYGFEIAEQLGMALPASRRVSGRGRHAAAAHRPRVRGAEDARLGRPASCRASTRSRPSGSAPVVRAFEQGLDFPEPVKPNTIAKSIAIGNPADGHHVLETLRATGGSAAMVDDDDDPRHDPAAGRDGRDLHGAGRRRDARRGDRAHQERHDPRRRARRRVRHRQRLQDVGRPHGTDAGAGSPRQEPGGVRGLLQAGRRDASVATKRAERKTATETQRPQRNDFGHGHRGAEDPAPPPTGLVSGCG